MRKISTLFWVMVLSLMMIGTTFAVDVPGLSTWTQPMGVGGGIPGVGDLLLAPLYDVRDLNNPDTGEGIAFKTFQQTLISILNQDNQYGTIVRLGSGNGKEAGRSSAWTFPCQATTYG
jgi:hypothetical protein